MKRTLSIIGLLLALVTSAASAQELQGSWAATHQNLLATIAFADDSTYSSLLIRLTSDGEPGDVLNIDEGRWVTLDTPYGRVLCVSSTFRSTGVHCLSYYFEQGNLYWNGIMFVPMTDPHKVEFDS